METIKVIILIFIALLLINIRIAVEHWGIRLTETRVTSVNHNYDVKSYGTISLDDRLVNVEVLEGG